MKHLAWSVLVGLVCFGLVGCGAPAGEPAAGEAAPVSAESAQASPAAPAADSATDNGVASATDNGAAGEPVAFRKDGKLMCPLMGSEIASEADAVGHVDFEGTRYYMCCTSCLQAGERDPAMVAQRASEL